jgi:hypothetical protein
MEPLMVSPERWATFCDDSRIFLASDYALAAAQLGWSTVEVFGVHPEKPVERFDHAGLVWLLNGSHVVTLSASGAGTKSPAGAMLSVYRRHSIPAGAVPAWLLQTNKRLENSLAVASNGK